MSRRIASVLLFLLVAPLIGAICISYPAAAGLLLYLLAVIYLIGVIMSGHPNPRKWEVE